MGGILVYKFIKPRKTKDRSLILKKALENQKLLSQDLKKFKLAVANASEHIVITDKDGYIIYANKAVEKITGFSVKEIIGKKAGGKDLWGGMMEPQVYKKFWKTIKIDKKTYKGVLRNKRKNGEYYDAEAIVSPVLNEKGQVIFFVGIERDITKAREVDRMKTEFVSLASHQLRTPLSSTKWLCEMLLAGSAGKLNKEQKEFITKINDSNESMISLVNSLLNISKLELGKIKIESKKTNLKKLIESIIEGFKPKIKAKKQKIKIFFKGNFSGVLCDSKIVREIYSNLISNAITYGRIEGEIKVELSKTGGTVLSKVTDNGYGIPKKEQSKIFQKFFRASNASKIATEGNGLGMYTIKGMVEASGGKIWFESKENKGTTFFFTLPNLHYKKHLNKKQ